MAVSVFERRGSGDFGGGSGKILFAVLGADDQDAAYAAALADPAAADQIGEYLQEDVAVADQGNGVFFVDVGYKRAVPNAASGPTAGETPTSARPAPAGHNNDDPLSRDVTFTMGGETKHITQSIETRYRVAKTDSEAPDFFGLIGYDRKTKEVHGCDVYAGTSDFTIAKRFPQLTIGWFRHALDLVATVNAEPFLGTDAQECLFLGCDGQYKDGDLVPWSVTGRWKYSRNRANVPVDNPDVEVAELVIPEVKGHDFIWVMYQQLTETYSIEGKDTPVLIERPQFAYCERVYSLDSEVSDGASFDDLGFN